MTSKKIANIRQDFSAENGRVHQDVAEFVKDSMVQLGVGKRLGARTVLLAEETTEQFLQHAPEGSSLRVRVKRFLGDTSVILSMPGEEFDPFASEEEESEEAIRSILLKSAGEKYKYRNRHRTGGVPIHCDLPVPVQKYQ